MYKSLLPDVRRDCLSTGLLENRYRGFSEPPASRQRRHSENGKAAPRLTSALPPPPLTATQLAREVSLRVSGVISRGSPDQTRKENQLLDYLHPALASVDATSLSLGSAMESPHLTPSRGGRQVRVPAPPGAVPGRREAPGAHGPWKFSPRRDPSSASRPYPATPFWGLVLRAGRRPEEREWLPVAA